MKSADQPQAHSIREAPGIAEEFADLGRALRNLFDPYRPERHYMRGPGPKWHAKQNPAPAVVEPGSLTFPPNGIGAVGTVLPKSAM